MSDHRRIQSQLYEYLRGELPESDRNSVQGHLSSCKQCTGELKALEDSLQMVERPVMQPNKFRSDLYWQQFADKVERRIREESVSAPRNSFIGQILDLLIENRKPFGIGFASALSLIALAFAAWSLWTKAPESQNIVREEPLAQSPQSAAPSIEQTSLELRTENYLEQSKVLLIGFVNADPGTLRQSIGSLRHEREVSRALVRESQSLVSSLNGPSQQRLRELVSDLGLILVQIANLESDHEVQGVEIVKNGVERNGILFKINLEEIQRSMQSGKAKETVKSTKRES